MKKKLIFITVAILAVAMGCGPTPQQEKIEDYLKKDTLKKDTQIYKFFGTERIWDINP